MMGVGKGPPRPRVERAREALALREEGLLQREIAECMEISRSYASALLHDPDGSQDKTRKASYGRTCENCGGSTDGSYGRAKAPRYCAHCQPHVTRKWTQERVIEAIREWARRRGEAPNANDWIRNTVDPDGYEFPARTAVYDSDSHYAHPNFQHWADAIEAAGFPRPSSARNYIKQGWEIENMTNARLTRDYLVFRMNGDGEPEIHAQVEAATTADAVEKTAESGGRYAAVAKSSLTEYTVQSRLVASAIPKSTPESEEPPE